MAVEYKGYGISIWIDDANHAQMLKGKRDQSVCMST